MFTFLKLSSTAADQKTLLVGFAGLITGEGLTLRCFKPV